MKELQVSNCLSIHAAAELVSQLTFYLFTDKLNISNKNCYMIGIIGATFARFSLLISSGFYYLLVISAIFGYFKALIVTNFMLVLAEYCSEKCPGKLSSAVSFNMMSSGLGVIFLGQFLGWSRVVVNDYAITFSLQNIFIYLVCIVWSLE